VLVLVSLFYPQHESFALEQAEVIERLTDQLVEIYAEAFLILRDLQKIIDSSKPWYPLPLADYLKDLFEKEGIYLEKDDFLGEVKDPYLEFGRMAGLVPSSYGPKQRISIKKAESIARELHQLKDKFFLDHLYGKFDMHEHYRKGGDVEDFLKASGSWGVSRSLFVPTGLGPDNRGYKSHQRFLVRYIKKLYPERIIAFCTVDEADPLAADRFERCLKAGGEGLKILGGHPNFYDEPLNSENMYHVYKVAEKYGVPVLVHGSIINIPEIRNQLDQVYSDFKDVVFIHAHYCSAIFNGINLDQCADLLDRHPNLYVDLSMGGGIKRYHKYLRKDLQRIKDFIVKYQDRILFGSDIILDHSKSKKFDFVYERMKCDILLHQKKNYSCEFGEKDRFHQGFSLDREILKKLYYLNPKKVLGF
jgi:predicted TIM-barrel fold metal-dependent hydrolase